MNPQSQEFEQLELYRITPSNGIFVISVDDSTTGQEMAQMRDALLEKLPMGTQVIVMNRVQDMLFIPPVRESSKDTPTE